MITVKKQAKYLQIAAAFRETIKQGFLMPDEPLPSSRTLAKQLNVNRHTVMAALAELVAQGWLETKLRSGYRVAAALPIQTSKSLSPIIIKKGNKSVINEINPATFQWRFRRQATVAVSLAKKASDYRYNFSGGYPDMNSFPFDEFKSCFNDFCQRPKIPSLSYGDSAGEPELISEISKYLRRVRSIKNKELLVCNGSQEGLYLISQLLLGVGDGVAVEERGYPPAWAAFKSTGANLVTIKQDKYGIIPEHLAVQLSHCNIKLIYLTPLHQYPTTVTLVVSRRMKIYQLAAQYGVGIIEDDYDHEFHYNSQPIAPMAADDPLGLVIYVSTFSKLMFGGARIGYVVANTELIAKLTAYKALINHKTNVMMQQTVAKWMQQGGFERHLRRMTRLYHKRRDFMINVLKGYQQQGLPISFTCPAGGMALWVNMGKSIVGLKETLLSKNVYLQTEVEFSLATDSEKEDYRFVRLGFAAMSETECVQGIKIIVESLYR
ncbi:PLP-dependent aminotransferase family protein [Colwellia asteriadis]